jgi:predicted transcriptional regulator of viral defense system
MRSAAEYIDHLQRVGRLCFTTEEAVAALGRFGRSLFAVQAQLRRLKAKGLIADPYRSFHVIVPPMYRELGCLPPEQFMPQLMAHLGEPYYVALLSAAAFHGAAHHAPMVFQVVVPRPRRAITCGRVKVDFVARHDMSATPVVVRNVATGTIRIASPAATALELVGYPERAGYLDNVATVLTELAEQIDPTALAAEARRAPVAWVQRLGYLLALVEEPALANVLHDVLATRPTFRVPLAPWAPHGHASRDARWQVLVNTTVEPDT